MPMMQFSVAPWRVLDEPHLKALLKAVKVRQEHKDYILSLARQSASTGEPIVRSMLAPVLEKNAAQREIILPPGNVAGIRRASVCWTGQGLPGGPGR